MDWNEDTVDCTEYCPQVPFRGRLGALRQPPAPRDGSEHPCPDHRGGQELLPRTWVRRHDDPTGRRGAGVSQETIYKTFGGKAALLKAVYDVSLAGDDDDVPLAQRPEAIAVQDAQTPPPPRRPMRDWHGPSRAASTRCSECSSGQATPTRPSPTSLQTTDAERHVGSRYYVQHWAAQGWLRDDVTLDHAVDTVWPSTRPQPAGSCSITAGAKRSTPTGSRG